MWANAGKPAPGAYRRPEADDRVARGCFAVQPPFALRGKRLRAMREGCVPLRAACYAAFRLRRKVAARSPEATRPALLDFQWFGFPRPRPGHARWRANLRRRAPLRRTSARHCRCQRASSRYIGAPTLVSDGLFARHGCADVGVKELLRTTSARQRRSQAASAPHMATAVAAVSGWLNGVLAPNWSNDRASSVPPVPVSAVQPPAQMTSSAASARRYHPDS